MRSPKRRPVNLRLTGETVRALGELSARTRKSKSDLVEAALASFLSPDASERLEAALGRRLDRISRQLERLERDLTIANDATALVARFLFAALPAVPEEAQAPAQAKGRERYEHFVETLGRRLAAGESLRREVLEDLPSV